MKKQIFTKAFKKAKVNYPWCIPQNIGREWDTTGINSALGKRWGQQAHRAVEEVKTALVLIGSPSFSTMNLDRMPKGAGDWSNTSKELWKRFWLWNNLLKDEPRPKNALILLAKGERIKAIEQEIGVSQGHGYGRKHIMRGVEAYIEILDMEAERVEYVVRMEQIRGHLARNNSRLHEDGRCDVSRIRDGL